MHRISRINRIARVCRLGGAPVPPVLLSVVVQAGGTSIVLTFDRAVDADGLFPAGFFLHATGGNLDGSIGDLGPGDPVVNSTTITFDSNTRAIAAGETITLDYTTNGDVRGHDSGISLRTVLSVPVTNNA